MPDAIERRDFFISFNGADLAHATALDAALTKAGFTSFFHPRDVPPGGNVPVWMEDAILNSAQTLALFSPDYMKQGAVYSLAEQYGSWWFGQRIGERKLIPILLRNPVEFKPIVGTLARIEVVDKAPEDAAAHIVRKLKGSEETEARAAAQTGASLPKIFHVAYQPNPNFSGRFAALDELQKSLRVGNAAVTAVAGTGGIGKTTLAAEYCHRFGARYAGVWWIRAEQDSVLLSDVVDLGKRLGVVRGENIEADMRATLDALTSAVQPWLLVYDNVPNPDALKDRMAAGATRSIVTSRRTDFDGIGKVTQLDQWSEEVTKDYLLSRTSRDDVAGAARLAKDLGGLPLAAEQAASFLRTHEGISFDAYVRDLVALIKRPKPKGAIGNYADTVYAAFVKSLETLPSMEGGEPALDTLRLCSFLSPDGVDLALLTVEWGHKYLPAAFAAAIANELAREDALASLTSLSLLRREDGSRGSVLILHRLLLDVARDWMGHEARAIWGGAAARLVSSMFPHEADSDPSGWPICARLMPHVAPLNAHAPRTGDAGKALDRILNQGSLYLSSRGDTEGALTLAEQSLTLTRAISVGETLDLAGALNNVGGLYTDVDRFDEAEKTIREAINIMERLNATDPRLAVPLNNLAEVFLKQSQFAKAEPLCLRAAEIEGAAYGRDSPEYGSSLLNLGALYAAWADVSGEDRRRHQATDYTIRGLKIARAARGFRHPETLLAYANLGNMKATAKNWAGAVLNLECALAVILSLDLAEHPSTLYRASQLALCWKNSGHSDKAARLIRGDISDIVPMIAQVEEEHRAWVAEDPRKRRFGPPSFFELHPEWKPN